VRGQNMLLKAELRAESGQSMAHLRFG
jgi:hypothetical protein